MTNDDDSRDPRVVRAENLLAKGQYGEAVVAARDLLSEVEAASGEKTEGWVHPIVLLGRALGQCTSQLTQESLKLAMRARELAHLHYGKDDARTVKVLHDCSLNLRSAGLLHESVNLSFEALEIADRTGSRVRTFGYGLFGY